MMEGLKITGASLTLDARCRVLETAVDAGATFGIGYWANVLQEKHLELDGEKRVGWVLIEDHEGAGETDATPDSRLRTAADRSPGRIGINTDNIEHAVAAMLADPEGCGCGGVIAQFLNSDGLDGPLADCIVQVACFGKVIYG